MLSFSSFPKKSFTQNRFETKSSQFQRKISLLEQDVLRMGALVEQSCRLSHQALFGRDLTAVDKIIAIDTEIDKFYRQIDMDSAQLMAIASPVAQDLRLLNAFIQMVRDLERIGDYAEDLGEISIKLLPYPVHDCMKQLESMSHKTRTMLARSLVAVSNLDSDARNAIELLDDEVDNTYDLVYAQLGSQRDFKGNLEPILLLALIMRNLERMADHANNVARRVHYIVTGQQR
jgi:phosphate transport system protein